MAFGANQLQNVSPKITVIWAFSFNQFLGL